MKDFTSLNSTLFLYQRTPSESSFSTDCTLNSTLFLYQPSLYSFSPLMPTPLNSTLFLYQRKLACVYFYCCNSFKFHSVPISTLHDNIERFVAITFKFHSVPISTSFFLAVKSASMSFKFHSVPISTRSASVLYWHNKSFKFHSVPISTPHKISSHPFTSSTASFVHLPANDNIPTLIYHKYFPLCPCTPDHFFPCQPPAIFAPLPVDRIRYKKKLVLSSSFPQNSLSSHFSWRLLKIITESSPLSI